MYFTPPFFLTRIWDKMWSKVNTARKEMRFDNENEGVFCVIK